MIPELGHVALILALCLALVQSILPLVGASLGNPAWVAVAKPAARGQFAFVLLAMVFLGTAFVQNDFSVLYVASHSNSALPLAYRVAAIWGGHEGSLLLWAFMLSAWGLAVSYLSRSLPETTTARVLGVMGLVAIGFHCFMLFTSNPFERLFPAPVDGADLNPLLQDPALVIHPPMLYMGYVGFSVAFSFAIAALIEGRLDAAWARWSRPWTLAAWAFLGSGIGLGSWWAYYELGWGGWWFWDPVENASFMPWLAGTALIHSLAVTEKRNSFKSWTVMLAIIAFSLSLLGTFLVRSGVLTSVHAFATDPARGSFILAFLAVVVGASLFLYALRRPQLAQGGAFSLLSRESFLLANNVLLIVAMITVLLGTLYPLIIDALGLGKISVGPPYFDLVFSVIMSPLVFLMTLGPVARWKKTQLPDLAQRLWWALAIAAILAVVVPLGLGRWSPLVALGIGLAAWVGLGLALDLHDKLRGPRKPILRALRERSRSYYGMVLAHLGVAVFIVGVTLSGAYSTEKELALRYGQSAELGGYRFTLKGVSETRGPNYRADEGEVVVHKGEREVAVLRPQKRFYNVQRQVMTEAAIDGGFGRHLYVALGERIDATAWGLRLYHKPFVQWIWLGVMFMAFGGVLAASDRRYRISARKRREALATGTLRAGANP